MSYLDEKYNQLVKEFGPTEIIRRIRDKDGTYALELKRPNKRTYLFAAKRNMDGTTVSINYDLWIEVTNKNIGLILAIDDNFYHFLPRNLSLADHKKNLRTTPNGNKCLMMNWDLKEACGRNLRYLGDKEKVKHPIMDILQGNLGLEGT